MIYGGRNDENGCGSQGILNDVFVLSLLDLRWTKVLFRLDAGPKVRFNHSSCVLGSKLVLFGGIGDGYKILKDYEEVELDQAKVGKQVSIAIEGGKQRVGKRGKFESKRRMLSSLNNTTDGRT